MEAPGQLPSLPSPKSDADCDIDHGKLFTFVTAEVASVGFSPLAAS